MNIYVKQTPDLTIKTVRPIVNDSINVYPLISTNDVSYNDLILVSKFDSLPLTSSPKNHVIIYESLLEQLSESINQIYHLEHDYYYLKYALNSSFNPEISTVISGSSYGAFGIDLSYIDAAINLSSISQDLYYSIKLLLQACQNNTNIKNIVLCVGYYCFYSDLSMTKSTEELRRLSTVYYPLLHDTHNCLFLPPKTDFCIQSNIINFEMILETFISAECQKGFFNESRPRSYYATKMWDDKSKNWCELSAIEQELAGRERAESHNRAINHHISYNENVCLFQDFVNFCNKRNINLLLTVTPATKHYLKYLNPEYKKNFYSTLEYIDGNIHLLDLSDELTFDNSIDFNDTDHLSDSGAAKLSSIINSILKDIS